MSECSSVGRARRPVCEEETASTPTAEQAEAAQIAREKEAEAAAEARRNAYYASTEHEGGRCKDASSDAGAYSPESPAQDKLRDSLRTAGEKPLESDPIGNGLVSAAGGAVLAGLGAAETLSAESGIEKGITSFVKSVLKRPAHEFVKSTWNTGPELAEPPATTTKPSVPGDGGRTGARATSEVAPEPNRSEAPPPPPGPVVIPG